MAEVRGIHHERSEGLAVVPVLPERRVEARCEHQQDIVALWHALAGQRPFGSRTTLLQKFAGSQGVNNRAGADVWHRAMPMDSVFS